MKVVYYPKPCPGQSGYSLAIGFFDGLHRGHQKIISHAIDAAKKNGIPSAVITFQNHPMHVLEGKSSKPLLTDIAHKLELIRRRSPDICYVIPFTRGFSKKSPEEFIKRVLVEKLRVREITVGFNFRFGHDRQGDAVFLAGEGHKLEFKTHTIGPVMCSGKPISSSRIREAVARGDLALARRMLGHPVTAMGTVVKGDGFGKKLGFPTANLRTNSDILLPHGVYSVDVFLEAGMYAGLLNIGPRSKITRSSKPEKVKVEIYLLNFKRNIYGCSLFVEVIKKFRDEMIYSDPQKLIRQIKKDVKKAIPFFNRRKNNSCYVNI